MIVSAVTADLRGWSSNIVSCLGLVVTLGLRVRLNMKKRARRMVAITNIVGAEGSKVEAFDSCALLGDSKDGLEGNVCSLSSGPGGLGRTTGMMQDRYVRYVTPRLS